MQQNKIFPEKLPLGFHGTLRQKQSLKLANQQLINQRSEEYEPVNSTLNGWKKHKTDKQVQAENRRVIQNPAKISETNPEYFKTTYQFHLRQLQKKRSKDLAKTNIFGQPVPALTRAKIRFPQFDKTPFKFEWPAEVATASSRWSSTSKQWCVQKIGSRVRNLSTSYKPEVSQRIGFSEQKIFAKPKTQVKIGHEAYVDTYQIA